MTYIVEYFESSGIEEAGGPYRAIAVDAETVDEAKLAAVKATDGKISKYYRVSAKKGAK